MPSIRATNKSRSKSVSKRTGRSKSPQPETKSKIATKATSKSAKSTPRSQPKKTEQKPEGKDRSTSKKVFTAAARQSTRGKIKPSANNEPAPNSRNSPRKEQRASEKAAGRTTSRTPAKSPRKASVSKSKQAENSRASKASPGKRASRSSKGTQSPAKTTKESVIYNSPQARPKRSRGFQSKKETKSPKTRNESKGSSPSRSPAKSRNTSAKLSKESPARPLRSTQRAATPKKSKGRVPSRKTSTAIETEDSKSKSPRKTTPKKITPKKSPAKVVSKKPSVSKSITDVSIPDPVTGFKRDASGKLVRRVDDEARNREIKNNLGMLLEDDDIEVEIAMASKNMETEESESDSDSEDNEATTTTKGYNLYEDWKLLAAAFNWIKNGGTEKALHSVTSWREMDDPWTGDKLSADEKDAKSKHKRYIQALYYLREEETDRIQDLCQELLSKELKKLRLKFEKLTDGRRLIGVFKQLKESRSHGSKLEKVIDAEDIPDYPEEEKERRRVEREISQEEAQEKEVQARKSPRKKMRKNDGNESIVPAQKIVSKAEQKRLEEQEFKVLKEDWQFETKSMNANEVFRNRKFEGQFAYDANFTTYVDPKQGFRQFVEEEAEPEVVQSKVFTQNKIGTLPVYAKQYGFSLEDVLTIYNSVSCDMKDLEAYLQTEDRSLLWTNQEDTDLLANNSIAMRYLIKIKGPLRIASRREYLKQVVKN